MPPCSNPNSSFQVQTAMPRIALVTCKVLPEPDTDLDITQSALHDIGINAEWVPWDDDSVEWSQFDLAILRSTWNYYRHVTRFQDWLRSVERHTRLLNPRQVVSGNLHKRYLLELANQGISVVPTVLISKNSDGFLDSPWQNFVLKPAVSASSFRTKIFDRLQSTDAQIFAEMILSDTDLLVQKYIPSVENGGEVAWIWIDGEITHGVGKYPRLHDDDESVSAAIFASNTDLLRLEQFVTQIPKGCLYARIDVVEEEGDWLLNEMELIEPSLYLVQNLAAAEKFAVGVARFLGIGFRV